MVLDSLHDAGIEIVSPAFMNQRLVTDLEIIPKKLKKPEVDRQLTQDTDSLIFDKAEKAETIEEKKIRLEKVDSKIKEVQELIKQTEGEDRVEHERVLERYKDLKEKMTKSLEEQVEEFKNQDNK